MVYKKGNLVFLAVLIGMAAVVGGLLLIPSVLGCPNTRCGSLPASVGTFTLDVYVNYTSGSPLHLSTQGNLIKAGEVLTVNNQAVSAVTAVLTLSPNVAVATTSGTIDFGLNPPSGGATNTLAKSQVTSSGDQALHPCL